jgi:protein-arginine deiminase
MRTRTTRRPRFLRAGAPATLAIFAALALPSAGAGCGSSSSAAAPTPIVAIAVDADRDGKADLASAGDRAHRNDFDTKVGASFLANVDDDDGDKISDANDDVVNGDDDAKDLAPITLAAFPTAPDGAVGKLAIDDVSAGVVRVFKKDASGAWVVVAGSMGACASPKLPCEQSVTEATFTADELRAGITLGIESRRFRVSASDPWSGEVSLSWRVLDAEGGTPYTTAELPDGTDHAKLRVAPWVLFGNLSPFDTVWSSAESAPLVAGVGEAAKRAGATHKTIKDWQADIWTQDFFQTAWTAMPGPSGTVQGMRVANPRPWGRVDGNDKSLPRVWLARGYLGPDRGVFQIYEKDWSGDTWDSHGNHDLIPPYENAAKGTKYPLGRIITGSNVLPETGAFYDAQKVQGPHLVVDSSWLYVGHVDEFLSYVPAATPRGWKLLVASPRLAKQMLEAQQTAGHGAEKMFVGKQRYQGESDTLISAEITIDGALADADLMAWSQTSQSKIDAVVAQLTDEIGLSADEIIEVPVLFEDIAGGKIAWGPGTVNLLAMGKVVAPPDPFGPVIGGADMWKTDLLERFGAKNALASDGKGLDVVFVDDWDDYHINAGEVHCGTNPEASAPFSSVRWWETGK